MKIRFLSDNSKVEIKRVVSVILDAVFPPRCIFCEKFLAENKGLMSCRQCLDKVSFMKDKRCCKKCCGIVKGCGKYCVSCSEFERRFEKNVSVFSYTGHVRKSVLRYKMLRRVSYSPYYAIFMKDVFLTEYSDLDIDFVTCVPMTKMQFARRGFNQSHELSLHLSEYLKLPYIKNILVKTKMTKLQKSLSYEERQNNLAESMRVNKKQSVLDKTILLVDDVCTTGATLDECSRVLLRSGAEKVYCLTLARTIFC